MSQHVYEHSCNYVIGPHAMFHVSRLYSKVSSSKSMPLVSPVWEYFKIVCGKKVCCKLCVPPATTTLCVCVCMRACVLACVHGSSDACISLCVCAQIIRYSIVTETTIRIAKITICFNTIYFPWPSKITLFCVALFCNILLAPSLLQMILQATTSKVVQMNVKL